MSGAKSDIPERNAEFAEFYRNKQFDRLYDFYTEDCQYMLPGREVIAGREGVRKAKLNEDLSEVGVTDLSLDTDEIVETGRDMAVERGHYTLRKSDGSLFDKGKYMVLWKKIKGEWRMHFEIFNSNLKR